MAEFESTRVQVIPQEPQIITDVQILQTDVASLQVNVSTLNDDVNDLRSDLTTSQIDISNNTSAISSLQTGKASLSGATFTGVVNVVSPTGNNSSGARKITISTGLPSGGADGDIWIVYA